MKVAIVGSRDYPNLDAVKEYIDSLPLDTIIVSGGARGVDRTAENRAKERGMKTLVFKPDWSKGGYAGIERNGDIVAACDVLVAFWDNKSPGTRNSINRARIVGKPVTIIYAGVEDDEST